MRCTLEGNKIDDHLDVDGASHVSAPDTSSFLTEHLASIDCAKTTARWDQKNVCCGSWCDLYWRFDSNCCFIFQSTVCQKIMEQLGQHKVDCKKQQVVIVSMENFYRPLSEDDRQLAERGLYNFDHPSEYSGQVEITATSFSGQWVKLIGPWKMWQ